MIYIGGTVDLTKIPKTCKTCKTWTPGADTCERNTIHQIECIASSKRIHWTPNPFALMKRIYCDTDGMTVTKPVDLIPRHAPIPLLTMYINSIYGKYGDYTEEQRFKNFKYYMKLRGIIQAADVRESGWYPYMRKEQQSRCICMKGRLCYNFCPDCGRKLN